MILNEPGSLEQLAVEPLDPTPHRRRRTFRTLGLLGLLGTTLLLIALGAALYARHYARTALAAALPQIDGTLTVPGLAAPVTVDRDPQGVPHIQAASLDDLLFAQGYVTAQDRLWQMDMLRRHASGQLAEVLGSSFLAHDRLQRTLGLDLTATRALDTLPPDQLHQLEQYARGVNALLATQRAHLPLEFLVLRYQPAPWTPHDSLLVALALFEDLTTSFPIKLSREALTARLAPELVADLYPTETWRDHPPDQPLADLTIEQPEDQAEGAPLDESQMAARLPPPTNPGAPEPSLSLPKGLDSETWDSGHQTLATTTATLLALNQALNPFAPPCDGCVSGSNAFAVSGAHTASGQPLLANDMHLNLTVPGTWYEANLEVAPSPGDPETKPFHVAGVSLPGTPFIVVGHNDHVAWGVTNLGGDVQDIYIEHTRGSGTTAEFLQPGTQDAPEPTWQPLQHRIEIIHVRGGPDERLDIALTRHGDTDTPVISALAHAPGTPPETRTLALRWTALDPANVSIPLYAVDSAQDGTALVAAFSTLGGPSQGLVYAESGTPASPAGHIGFHAFGRIPIRGSLAEPSPLSGVPIDTAAPDAALHEWAGYVPYAELPHALDPADGVLVTANGRITPPGYPYPINLDWSAPYRTERLYRRLDGGTGLAAKPRRNLTPADMLALQNDVYSELDHIMAQRLAYAIDHTSGTLKGDARLHAAADLLRTWNGHVDANSPAAAIVIAARAAFWPMLLDPRLKTAAHDTSTGPAAPAATKDTPPAWTLYNWGNRAFVEEQLLMHTPARWLPPTYATWDDFLAAVVDTGLRTAHAPASPSKLSQWTRGKAYPIDIEHAIYSRSRYIARLLGFAVGTGLQPQSGDDQTVRQTRPPALAFGPSERFTADLADPDHSTLNIVLGQSGSPASPWYLDQFKPWLAGTTHSFALHNPPTTHTLTLQP